VAVEQAQIDQAKATISNLDAQIDAQRARINQADKQLAESQAAEAFAKQENDRAQDLLIRGAGTQEQAQQNFSNYTQARRTLQVATRTLPPCGSGSLGLVTESRSGQSSFMKNPKAGRKLALRSAGPGVM